MTPGADHHPKMRDAECEALRARIRELIAENDALRRIAGHKRPEFPPPAMKGPDMPGPFDWRHVLCNPQFGWPEDVIAQAESLRDRQWRGA